MKIGLYQNNPTFGEVEKNVADAVNTIAELSADLLVLPELFNTGYQFLSRNEAASLAEEVPGGFTCRAMMKLAKEKKMHIVFGVAERKGDFVYNSAAVVGPSGFVGLYRKTHLFDEEKLLFDPGDTGFRVWNIGGATIGVMICFDWFFPESARILSLLGADIICHPANLVLPYCQYAMPVRCLENRVFSITANRTGTEKRGGKKLLTYTGNSLIVNPMGQVLKALDGTGVGTIVLEVDPKKAKDKRVTTRNDLFEDRRPSLYGPLMQ